MKNDQVGQLFNIRSHNPSFFSVKESNAYEGELLDFCIPVNLHFPPVELVDLVHSNLPEILRYYPDYSEVHARHLAQLVDLDRDMIVPCNGSTEIITQLCQLASGPLLTSIPTFSRWTDLPIELGLQIEFIKRQRLSNYRLRVEEIVSRVCEVGAKSLVISNPNNPTGAWFSYSEIEQLCEALPDLETLIVDESFIDFSELPTAAPLTKKFANLVVVKSLGKSLGWHGVRLGYAATNPQRAELLRDRLPFWNINGLAAFILKEVGTFKDQFQLSFLRTARDRDYMFSCLSKVSELAVFESKANFLYVELPKWISGRVLRDELLSNHGVMVRECSNKLGSSEQYLRVAVQKPAAVDRLASALRVELDRLGQEAKKLSAA